ncbi:hypothetical protein OAV88_03100, partial [bacterium]|nr:hypothetical protein [bacterium]
MCKKYCCDNWEGRCLVITVLLLNIGGIVVFSWALSVGLNEECKEMPDLWKHVTAIGALGKHIHTHTLSLCRLTLCHVKCLSGIFMFCNLPIGVFVGSSIAWPDGDYLTVIWCAVPFIANLSYGSYVIATQFDDKSGESCQKMRDFAKLESISAIVFGLLYACLFCFVAIVVHSLKKIYSYHGRMR